MAAKLTGWNVDIDGADDAGIEEAAKEVETPAKPKRTADLEDALIAASSKDTAKDKAEESETVEKEEKLEDTEDK